MSIGAALARGLGGLARNREDRRRFDEQQAQRERQLAMQEAFNEQLRDIQRRQVELAERRQRADEAASGLAEFRPGMMDAEGSAQAMATQQGAGDAALMPGVASVLSAAEGMMQRQRAGQENAPGQLFQARPSQRLTESLAQVRTQGAQQRERDDAMARIRADELAASQSFTRERDAAQQAGRMAQIGAQNAGQMALLGARQRAAEEAAANQPPAPRRRTEGQLNASVFATRMEQTGQVLNALEQDGVNPVPPLSIRARSLIPFVGDEAKNAGMTASQQKYWAAAADWVRAKLRKESGAAIGVKEMADEIATYFPMAGDDASTVEYKRQLRATAEQGMRGLSEGDVQSPVETLMQTITGGAGGMPSSYSPNNPFAPR